MDLGLATGTRRTRFTLALFSFACLLCSSTTLLAQSTNASVTGRILDPGNAVIVGAEISIINTETKVRYTGEPNEDGIYLVSNIQPGIYLLQFRNPASRRC